MSKPQAPTPRKPGWDGALRRRRPGRLCALRETLSEACLPGRLEMTAVISLSVSPPASSSPPVL